MSIDIINYVIQYNDIDVSFYVFLVLLDEVQVHGGIIKKTTRKDKTYCQDRLIQFKFKFKFFFCLVSNTLVVVKNINSSSNYSVR